MPSVNASSLQRTGGVQSRAELEALIRSRDELRSQLDRVTGERAQLAQERLNAEARAQHSANPTFDRRMIQEYQQQISELGERRAELQSQIAQADVVIANAIARDVGRPAAGERITSTVQSVPGGDFAAREALLRRRYETMMLAEAATLVLACVVIGRVLWRRASRTTAGLFASEADMSSMKVAIDAIAVEVERISEGQRYTAKLLQERSELMPRVEPATGTNAGAELRREEPPAR